MKRDLRLTRSQDFDRVLRSGRRFRSTSLTVFVSDNEGGGPRVGLAVSRRLGNAVVRNRIKRRLRAIVGEMVRASRTGRDVVIVAKAPVIEVDAAHLRAEVAQAWVQAVETP